MSWWILDERDSRAHTEISSEITHIDTTLSFLGAVTQNGTTLCVLTLLISTHDQRIIVCLLSESTLDQRSYRLKPTLKERSNLKGLFGCSSGTPLHKHQTDASSELVSVQG